MRGMSCNDGRSTRRAFSARHALPTTGGITEFSDFDNVEFRAVSEEIRRKTCHIGGVQSAFRKTGLSSLNPEEVR